MFRWKIWVNGEFYKMGTGEDNYIRHVKEIRSNYNNKCEIKSKIT